MPSTGSSRPDQQPDKMMTMLDQYRKQLEAEAKFIIAGYPKSSEIGGHRPNARVYIDHSGRLCIHGGDTGGILFIEAKDQHVIEGDVAPGH